MSRLMLGLIVGALGWSAASCAREPTDLLPDESAGPNSNEGEDDEEDAPSSGSTPRKPDARVADARVPDAGRDASTEDAAEEPGELPTDVADAGVAAPAPAPAPAPRDAGSSPAPAAVTAPTVAPAAKPTPATSSNTNTDSNTDANSDDDGSDDDDDEQDAGRRFPNSGSRIDRPEGIGRRGSNDGGVGTGSLFGSFGDFIREGIERYAGR